MLSTQMTNNITHIIHIADLHIRTGDSTDRQSLTLMKLMHVRKIKLQSPEIRSKNILLFNM